MRVIRDVQLNPIEAPQISLMLPANMPLTLDINYVDLLGQPLNVDVVAQMQLTARSSGKVDYYSVPATDIVNGKARLTINRNTLNDPNGYRMLLTGNYKSEERTLALGTLRITPAAGVDTTPDDVLDQVPITIPYGFAFALDLKLWKDAAKSTPFDLSSATISATIYSNRDLGTVLVPFTVGVLDAGHILLQLTVDQVNALPANAWWSLRASSAAGVTTLAEGPVTCTGMIAVPTS